MSGPSAFLTACFAALSLAIAVGFVCEVGWASARAKEPPDRRWKRVRNAAAGILVWMTVTGGVASAGLCSSATASTEPALVAHEWPGNVRELRAS